MRSTKSIKTVILASFCMGAIFTSCNNDEATVLEAKADVFVFKTKTGEVEQYAPAFYVYGNKDLKTVTAQPKDDETSSYTLLETASTKSIFILVPEEDDYTETSPVEGEYNFTVTSTDEADAVLTVKDILGDESLDVPELSTSEFADNKLKMTWESITDADGYIVQLYDGEDLLFSTSVLASTVKEFAFGLSSNGWLDTSKKAENGKTYSLRFSAVRFETGITLDKGNNIQCISFINNDIEWVEAN